MNIQPVGRDQRDSIPKRMLALTCGVILMGVGAWTIVRVYEITGSSLLSLTAGAAAAATCALLTWDRGSKVPPATRSEKTIWLVLFGPLFFILPAIALYELTKTGGVEFGVALVALLFGTLLGLTWKVLRG